MKKFILLLLCLCSQRTFAQITINSALLPVAGQTWIEAADEFYSAPITPGGANQIWNYSGLLTTTLDTTRFINAAATPYASSFPNSNLAINQTDDSIYIFITTNSSGLTLDGYYFYNVEPPFGTNVLPFLPAYSFVPTPFTYLDTQNSTYKYVIDIDTALPYFRFVHHVDVSLIGDGYGSLQLPGITYPNTLRTKQIEVAYDSLLLDTAGNGNYFSFGPPTIEQSTTYKWFKASQPAIVLTLDADSAGTTCNRSSYLYNSFTTSVGEIPLGASQVHVYPNPSSNLVTIKLPQEGTSKDVFQLYDVSGRVIRETSLQGMKQYSFYVNNLQSGVYFWSVKSLSASGKLVVE